MDSYRGLPERKAAGTGLKGVPCKCLVMRDSMRFAALLKRMQFQIWSGHVRSQDIVRNQWTNNNPYEPMNSSKWTKTQSFESQVHNIAWLCCPHLVACCNLGTTIVASKAAVFGTALSTNLQGCAWNWSGHCLDFCGWESGSYSEGRRWKSLATGCLLGFHWHQEKGRVLLLRLAAGGNQKQGQSFKREDFDNSYVTILHVIQKRVRMSKGDPPESSATCLESLAQLVHQTGSIHLSISSTTNLLWNAHAPQVHQSNFLFCPLHFGHT